MPPIIASRIGSFDQIRLIRIIDLRIVLEIVGTVDRSSVHRVQRISYPMRHVQRLVVTERIVAHGTVIERSEVADVNKILISLFFRQLRPSRRMPLVVGIVGRRGRKLRQHEHLRLTAEKFEFDGRRTFPAPGIRRVIDVQDIADVRTLYGALLHEDRRIVEPERAPSTSVLDFGTPSGADRSLNLYGGRTLRSSDRRRGPPYGRTRKIVRIVAASHDRERNHRQEQPFPSLLTISEHRHHR